MYLKINENFSNKAEDKRAYFNSEIKNNLSRTLISNTQVYSDEGFSFLRKYIKEDEEGR